MSRGAYVGRVFHCQCGHNRRSRHQVRLVWGNGSFGSRTIAARTWDLIPDMFPRLTFMYIFACQYLRGLIFFWGISTIYVGVWSHLEILTQVCA